jgi:hypothetical protein
MGGEKWERGGGEEGNKRINVKVKDKSHYPPLAPHEETTP